jgi:hypothetical protein
MDFETWAVHDVASRYTDYAATRREASHSAQTSPVSKVRQHKVFLSTQKFLHIEN